MSYFSRADKIPCPEDTKHDTDGNIAAIDFGTTSLSVAYSTKGDPTINTIRLDTKNQRVANAILIQKDEMKVLNIGEVAREKFTLMRSIDHPKFIYFERIKMLLRREKCTNRQSLVKAFSGEEYYLVEVIAFILKYLKDQLIDHLSRSVIPLKTTDFDWVITVPAIWDARGKSMMREAAYLAGLLTESSGITQFTSVVPGHQLPVPKETNPERLTLALEPEAAAFYSQEMVGQQINSAGDQAAIERPSRYMVIDIGGGTVDITIHSESEDKIIVESVPTGNDCGGTQVNEAFRKMLQDLVQDSDFSNFLTESKNRATLNDTLYNEFEKQKILFGDCKIDNEIAVELPKKFTKLYGKNIEAEVDKINGVEYEDDDDTLYISQNVIESELFSKALDGIINCTISAIEENECKVNTFYLVGGFGGCKYIHEKIRVATAKFLAPIYVTANALVPVSPQLAVATGAVMWRMKTMKVTARRADATYGIGASIPFDPDKHNEYYRFYNEELQGYWCGNVFSVFLEKGELVNVGEVTTITMAPSHQSNTNMAITIYCTPEKGVQYTKDKNDKFLPEIGRLVINIPNPDNQPREERKVDITMDFSGTEIQAKAKYRVTDEEVKIVCDFLSAQ